MSRKYFNMYSCFLLCVMFFCVSACQCEPINVEARRQSQLSLSTSSTLFFLSGTCQIRYASWTVSPGHLPISASPELRSEYTISVPVFVD